MATPNRNFVPIDIEPEMEEALLAIDVACRKALSKQYKLIMPADFQCTTIAYTYLKEMFIHLRKQMEAEGDASRGAWLNFMDLMEINIDHRQNDDAEKEGNLNLMITPGANAKLAIKSDALTEDN